MYQTVAALKRTQLTQLTLTTAKVDSINDWSYDDLHSCRTCLLAAHQSIRAMGRG
jgi:hypothetical protein